MVTNEVMDKLSREECKVVRIYLLDHTRGTLLTSITFPVLVRQMPLRNSPEGYKGSIILYSFPFSLVFRIQIAPS